MDEEVWKKKAEATEEMRAEKRQVCDAEQVNDVEVMDNGNDDVEANIDKDNDTETGFEEEIVPDEFEFKEDGQGVEAAKEGSSQSNNYEELRSNNIKENMRILQASGLMTAKHAVEKDLEKQKVKVLKKRKFHLNMNVRGDQRGTREGKGRTMLRTKMKGKKTN